MRTRIPRRPRAFLLIEVLLAVTIFAFAVIGLGKCVQGLLSAQAIRDEDEKIRRFLDSKMAEIEAGAVVLNDSKTEDIKGWLPGMKLKTTRTPLKRKDENDRDIVGLYTVNLEASWLSDNQEQSRSLMFYIYPTP